jgi:hypothetical protein
MTTIDIIRSGRAVPITIDIDEKTIFFKKLMGEHKINCEIVFPGVLDVLIGDWIVFGGENYTINYLPKITKINSSTYKYNIEFDANIYNLTKKLIKDNVIGLTDFAYNGSPVDFINKIIANINEINPTWTAATGTNSTGINKTLQFTNESCLSALSKVAEAYRMEYDINDKVIGLQDSIAGVSGFSFEYGKNNGLYQLEREQVSNQNIITRCYGFGGTTNIPFGYRAGSQRLIFDAGNDLRYLENAAAVSLYGIIEGVYVDDNIFPQRTSALTDVYMEFNSGPSGSVARVDKVIKNNASGDCVILCNGYEYTMFWNTNAQTTVNAFWSLRHNDFGQVHLMAEYVAGDAYLLFIADVPGVDFIGATTITAGTVSTVIANSTGGGGSELNSETSYIRDSTIDFDINAYLIAGQTPTIVFKSGDLDGVACEISKFENASKRMYIKAFTDVDGYTKPNQVYAPASGDNYTLINISLPQSYIDTAETDLKAATQRYLDENCAPHVLYNLDIDPKDAKLNNISLKAGDRVTIIDSALSINKLIRISSIEYPLVNIYKIKVVLANPVVPYTIQERLIKAASIVTKGALFSTSSPTKGMVPGANNAGANYFLNAKGVWTVPVSSTTTTVVVPKETIHFTSTKTPSITDYQTNFAATHGENPVLILKTILNGNLVMRNEQPTLTMVNGLIDSIAWDLPDLETGYIILQ